MHADNQIIKLDLGSGYSHLDGYLRLDCDHKCEPDIICDCSQIPLDDNFAGEIYSAHLLEHYDPKDTFRVLREWYRVLKPGGRLHIIVPDVGRAAIRYANNEITWSEFKKVVFGSDPTANDFMRHKEVFCKDSLRRMLFITGYVKIQDNDCEEDLSMNLDFFAYKPEVKK